MKINIFVFLGDQINWSLIPHEIEFVRSLSLFIVPFWDRISSCLGKCQVNGTVQPLCKEENTPSKLCA